jgi:hypothetical protein
MRAAALALLACGCFGEEPSGPALELSVIGEGEVTVSGGGLDEVCAAQCRWELAEPATLLLAAEAAAGWAFGMWTGDCAGGPPVAMIRVDEVVSCAALFVELP